MMNVTVINNKLDLARRILESIEFSESVEAQALTEQVQLIACMTHLVQVEVTLSKEKL